MPIETYITTAAVVALFGTFMATLMWVSLYTPGVPTKP